MKRHLVLLASLALATTGCPKKEPTADEVLAKHKATIEPRANHLEAIAHAALPAAKTPVKVSTPLAIIHHANHPVQGNASFVFAEDLKDLSTFDVVDLRTSDTMKSANHCWMIAKKHLLARDFPAQGPQPWGNTAYEANEVEVCAALRYLLVVRMSTYSPTKDVGDRKYIGGTVKGDVLVFDLDTGAYAGSVPFDATSSAWTKGSADADFRDQAYKAITSAVESAVPGSRVR